MTAVLPSPRALYRDGRLTETDRRVFLTAVEEGMLDLVEFREIKLSVLASQLRGRAGRPVSRATICRSLDRLVRTEYLARETSTDPRAPRRYRIRLSSLNREGPRHVPD